MGGFGGVVRDLVDRGSVAIGNALEHGPIKSKIVNALDHGPAFTQALAKGLRLGHYNMDSEFIKTEAGKDLKAHLGQIEEEGSKLYGQFSKAALDGKPVIISSKGVPKPLVDPNEMHSHAMKTARANIWGSKDQIAQTLLTAAAKQGGNNHAQILSSHLMVSLHDTAPPGTGLATMAHNFRTNNAVKGAETNFTALDTQPYKAPNAFERVIKKYSNIIFAGKAAGPHSTNFMMNTLNNSIKSSMEGMLATLPINGNYENSKLFLEMMGAMPEFINTEYKQIHAYQSSWLKGQVDKHKWIPGSMGELIHRNFSMPGLSAVRRVNLVNSAMVNKYELEDLANMLMKSKDPRLAEIKLTQRGLNPDKIRSQNGFLNPEDYSTGIFKSVNEDMGLTGSLHRTNFSQATMRGRMAFQFHSAITKMAKTVHDGYMHDFKNRDYVGLARRTAILSLAFPEFGNGINFVEDVWGGKGVDNSWSEYKEREGKMWGSHGPINVIAERIFAMAHMGVTGTSINYARSLGRNQLAKQITGPLVSSGFEIIQDGITAWHTDAQHPNRGDQLERDLIRASLPAWISGIVAHNAVPNKEERDRNKPKTAKSIRSKARRNAIKRLHPSNNPINRMDDELKEK